MRERERERLCPGKGLGAGRRGDGWRAEGYAQTLNTQSADHVGLAQQLRCWRAERTVGVDNDDYCYLHTDQPSTRLLPGLDRQARCHSDWLS